MIGTDTKRVLKAYRHGAMPAVILELHNGVIVGWVLQCERWFKVRGLTLGRGRKMLHWDEVIESHAEVPEEVIEQWHILIGTEEAEAAEKAEAERIAAERREAERPARELQQLEAQLEEWRSRAREAKRRLARARKRCRLLAAKVRRARKAVSGV